MSSPLNNTVIRASAGTGKTFALSNRYLQLLFHGDEVQTILASTFTKKGAGEILDRIVSRLAKAALAPDAATKLAKEIEMPIDQNEVQLVLHRLLKNLHRLEIGTLDSFFNRIASIFSLELGLPPAWQIVTQQQQNRLTDQAIARVLQDDNVLDILHLLTKGEITRRIAAVVRNTVDNIYQQYRESAPDAWDKIPEAGLLLTEQQRIELQQQLAALDFQGKALPNLRDKIIRLISQEDWDTLAKETVLQSALSGNPTYYRKPIEQPFLGLLNRMIDHLTAWLRKMIIHQNHATRDLLTKYDFHLHQLQNQLGELRFDDVTNRLKELVKSWDFLQCNYRLDSQIHHLLLDEFQDTSLAQWQILLPFAQRITENATDKSTFFCVGDMKQAIYGWRGGVAEIFDLVQETLPGLKSDNLAKSFRSSPPIIDFVNQVFGNLDAYQCDNAVVTAGIREWGNWFGIHSTDRNELTGCVTIERATTDTVASLAALLEMESPSDSDFVDLQTVYRIQQLVKDLPAEKSIGLIVRTNAEVSRLIAIMQQAGIKASEEGGVPLTDSGAVDLILSALQLADQPGDSLARFHLSHSPLATPLGLIPQDSQLDQNQAIARAHTVAAELRRKLDSAGYGLVIEQLANHLFPHCTRHETNRLRQLIKVAWSASPTNQESARYDPWQLRPGRFAQFVRDEVRVADPSAAQIRVMTIHKAKGLEFDVVVYPIPESSQGWNSSQPVVVTGREHPTAPIDLITRYVSKLHRGYFPGWLNEIFDAELRKGIRESLCVMYVALTRAAHAAHLIVSPNAKSSSQSAAGILLATTEFFESELQSKPSMGSQSIDVGANDCNDEEFQSDPTERLFLTGQLGWYQRPVPLSDEPMVRHRMDSDLSSDSKITHLADSHTVGDKTDFYLPDRLSRKHSPCSMEIRSGRGVAPEQLEA